MVASSSSETTDRRNTDGRTGGAGGGTGAAGTGTGAAAGAGTAAGAGAGVASWATSAMLGATSSTSNPSMFSR